MPFLRLEAPRVREEPRARSVAQALAERCENVTVLHDRALGRGLTAADIAVAPSGVYVIESRAAVSGVVCFVDDQSLPVLRTLTLRGVPLLDPRGLARRLRRRGPLTGERARRIADRLSELLPAA